MKAFKSLGILLFSVLISGAFTSCRKINERFDKLDQRLDKLENTTIASVNTQITNINNSIPVIEQSIDNLKDYVSLLKKENVSEFSISITNIEQYISNLNIQLTEIKNYTQNIINQETVNNEVWVDITIKTMNLYKSIQNQLSLVKVEINDVKQTITNLKLEVNQSILEYNMTLITLINRTETSIMSWVNERFTAYYTIAEVNAQIQNLIVENNVEINNSIEAMLVMLNDIDVRITNIYTNVVQEAITYCEGTMSEIIIQKINEATINLNVSIETINSQITEIENKLIIIDNSVNTINQQVTAINVSIEQMTVLQQQITQYITILQQDGDTYNTQITLLQKIQSELSVKIQELNVYVENIVNNFNTTIIDTKNWVSITFATIEQYNTINTTIINIQAIINVVQTNILEINQSIVNINSNITNIQNSITISITNLDKSTQEWVNKKLSDYLTVREANEQFAYLEAQIKNLYNYIKETDEESLIARMEAVEKEIADLNRNLTETVKKAVEEAILNHDGNIQAELDAINASIAALQNSVDNVYASISALKYQIVQLQSEIDQIKKDLYESIQSITVIPTYSDGSVAVESDICAIEFEVFPILSSQTVNTAAFIQCLSFDALNVQTKSGSTANPLKNLSITKVEMSGDFLRVYVNFAGLDNNFFSGEQAMMGRLRFNSGNMYKSSGYFALYPHTSSKTSAYIQSAFRNSVSGAYDVTSIVFRYNDQSTNTGTEVQTADSQIKIYANISGSQMTISTPASQIFAPAQCDMFCKMAKLKSIDFGEGFNTSLVESMYEMFYCCDNLESLDLSGFDFSNVSDTRLMIYYTRNLSYLDFGNNDLSHVPMTKIDGMCERLAYSISKCKIRCNASTQKFLREDNIRLDNNKIEWVLTD